ncbi:MAG TPA: hypothetical protein VF519_18165 [Mycobacteriales bacterium]|jgi:hypothetical protein
MKFRRIGTVLVSMAAASAAAVAMATPSHAVMAPTTALQIRNLGDSGESAIAIGAIDPSVSVPNTSIGACNFLFSGPSTSPSSTPFHIEGQASVTTTRLVTSVELSCRLTTTTGTNLGTLTRNLAGYSSAVAGDINVSTFGPFYICTMVNVHFENGDESNPNEYYTCQPLQSIAG